MKLTAISSVAAMSMLLLGCTQQADAPDATATTADALGPGTVTGEAGIPVSESLFRYAAMNGAQKAPEALTPEEREGIIDQLVDLKVLAEAAVERGLPQERTVAVELELQRLQVLARNMINRYVEQNPPTEAELQEAYESSISEFETTEYKARHILVESQEEANEIIQELEGGAEFASLAEEHSTGPTGPDGGDLGWFTANSMVEPFAQAVTNMEVGTYTTEPVQTQFGWHVILLEDQRQTEPPGLDAVREQLSNSVMQEKVRAYLDSLRGEAEAGTGSSE